MIDCLQVKNDERHRKKYEEMVKENYREIENLRQVEVDKVQTMEHQLRNADHQIQTLLREKVNTICFSQTLN